VMALFSREPTPKEILVERVGFLRWAERDGRFDQAVEMLNAHWAGPKQLDCSIAQGHAVTPHVETGQ
jgi:hypothetical protein